VDCGESGSFAGRFRPGLPSRGGSIVRRGRPVGWGANRCWAMNSSVARVARQQDGTILS